MKPIKEHDFLKNITKCQEVLSLMERAKAELMSIEKGCGHYNDFEDKMISEMLEKISDIIYINKLYMEYLEECKNDINMTIQTAYGPPPLGLNEKFKY